MKSNFNELFRLSNQEGFERATNADTIYGWIFGIVYYDRVLRNCLVLDVNRLGDVSDKESELIDEVKKHPARFVLLPHLTSADTCNIMARFAEKMKSAELLEALDADEYPECEFEDVAKNLGVYWKWQAYYKNFVHNIFDRWAFYNDIVDFNFEI